jgi:hypothetical protein
VMLRAELVRSGQRQELEDPWDSFKKLLRVRQGPSRPIPPGEEGELDRFP